MKQNKKWNGVFGTNALFLLGVLAAVLTFGLVLAGCDDGNKDEDDPPPPFAWPTELRGTLWSSGSGPIQYLGFQGDSDGDYLTYPDGTTEWHSVTPVSALSATSGTFTAVKDDDGTIKYFMYLIPGSTLSLYQASTAEGLLTATATTFTEVP